MTAIFELDGIYVLLLGHLLPLLMLVPGSLGFSLPPVLYAILGLSAALSILLGGINLHREETPDEDFLVELLQ